MMVGVCLGTACRVIRHNLNKSKCMHSVIHKLHFSVYTLKKLVYPYRSKEICKNVYCSIIENTLNVHQ